MSNFNKNLFVGLGGKEAIDHSHFIGACYGMERMMGRADNPLRRILNRAAEDFLIKLPLVSRNLCILIAVARERVRLFGARAQGARPPTTVPNSGTTSAVQRSATQRFHLFGCRRGEA